MMDKEHDILKWFEGQISTETIKARYPDEDFSSLEKLGFYAKHIAVPDIDAQEAWHNFKARSLTKETPKVIPLNVKSFLRIAAILVVMLTSSYFLFFNTTRSYTTDIAQTKTLTLPDNSEVVLNAQSKLVFNKKAWETERKLNLEGEAFFSVTKGKTFTVNTNVASIEVLGTKFNVKTRPNYFEVQCYEGSVSVIYKTGKNVLTPGKMFRVINDEVMHINDFEAQKPSWLVKESTFDNVPLWQVINELEIQYDITITAHNIDSTKMFTGGFTHTDKNLALQSVTIPLKLSYKIHGKKVEFYKYDAN